MSSLKQVADNDVSVSSDFLQIIFAITTFSSHLAEARHKNFFFFGSRNFLLEVFWFRSVCDYSDRWDTSFSRILVMEKKNPKKKLSDIPFTFNLSTLAPSIASSQLSSIFVQAKVQILYNAVYSFF